MRLLIFGMGYSARAVAAGLAPGSEVIATARDDAKRRRLDAQGVGAIAPSGPALAAALSRATHLLVTAAPDAAGDPLLAGHRSDVLAAPDLGWIGYLSTVGVYGDTAGAWVDETTPPAATSERGVARIAAERDWLDVGRRRGTPVQIFRLGGIYGPGRNVLIDLAAGRSRRIIKPGQVFNRIHATDIGALVRAGMARPTAGPILNGVDGHPTPPQDVIAYAATLLGLPLPPALDFDTAPMSPMARSFYSENRRVSNATTLASLALELTYPTYRAAIDALHAARDWERPAPEDA